MSICKSYATSLVGVTPRGIFVSQSARTVVGRITINKMLNIFINHPLFNELIITKY